MSLTGEALSARAHPRYRAGTTMDVTPRETLLLSHCRGLNKTPITS